jgi:redox-sensitive bicupin YhaK (pirin superfamily)
MISVRRAKDRRLDHRGQQETWLTFNAQERADPLADGFHSLQSLNECRLPPGGGSPTLPHTETEIITYVLEGALAYDDSLGRSGAQNAGEFRRMTAGRNVRCTDTNASRNEWVRVFQLWLRSRDAGAAPGHEQKRFSVAERRGGLRLVASPDARLGSLHLREDARVYSGLLEPGQHVVHELEQGRAAWLHIVAGEITLGDEVLCSGDGAGIGAQRPVSFTARAETEILLVDLIERPPHPTRGA